MYTVYTDEKNIYNPLVKDLAILSTKLDLELNKVGSFSFTIPATNPYINSIVKLKTLVRIYEDDELIFRGRVLNDQETFNKSVKVTCEGELAFLNDSIQRPFTFKGTVKELFTRLVEKHNEKVDDFKKFKVGNVTVTDPNDYISRSDTEYSKTLTLINDQLIKTLGGYIWFRYEDDGVYIDYLKDFTTLNRQPIEFGKNLLDLNKYSKANDIATVIIPLGAKTKNEDGEDGQRLTIESVNNGLDYIVDEEAVKLRGWIEKTVIFEDVTEPTHLIRKGREQLSQTVLLANSFELNAVDLSSHNQNFNNFKMGAYVQVKTLPHGIDTNLLVNKLSIDLQKPTSNKLTLGSSFATLTDKQHDFNNKYQNVVETIETIKNNIQGQVIVNIGGRNLLPNSEGGFEIVPKDETIENANYNYYKFDVDMKMNETYTISADIEITAGKFTSVSVCLFENGMSTPVLIPENKRITYTFKKTDETTTSILIYAGIEGETVNNGMILRYVKIERGNRATDWTPAIEDIDDKINDANDTIIELTQELSSEISQTKDSIVTEVGEKFYTKEETETLVSEQSTVLEQTKKMFEMQFNSFKQDLDDLNNSTNASFEDIRKYIRFIDGKILLGQVGNEIELQISNDKISFLQGNHEVAFFSNSKLYVTDAEVLNSLGIGKFAFLPRPNGSLDFKKVGE